MWNASSDKEGGGVGRSHGEEKFNDVVLFAESWSREVLFLLIKLM